MLSWTTWAFVYKSSVKVSKIRPVEDLAGKNRSKEEFFRTIMKALPENVPYRGGLSPSSDPQRPREELVGSGTGREGP